MFNDLPLLVKVKIFSFLNLRERIAVQRVCKHWFEVSQVSINGIHTVILFADVRKNRYCSEILYLVEKGVIHVINWNQIQCVLSKCTNMKKLYMYGCDEYILRNLLKMSRIFEKLEVFYTDCHDRWYTNHYKRLRRNMDSNPFMIRTSLTNTSIPKPLYSPDLLFTTVLKHPCNVNTLYLQSENIQLDNVSLPSLRKLAIRYSVTNVLEILCEVSVKSAEKLEALAIPKSDKECLSILPRFVNLKDLRINARNMPENWSEFFPFTKLEVLKFQAEYLDVDQLVEVVQRNRRLKVLDLNMLAVPLDSRIIRKISQSCKELRILFLNNQEKAANEWFVYLLDLPKLEVLSLRKASGDDLKTYCESVCHFIRHARSLRVIETVPDASIMQAFAEKANENPTENYFCNICDSFWYDSSNPKNVRTFKTHSLFGYSFVTERKKQRPWRNYLDYFDWKRIPRVSSGIWLDAEKFFRFCDIEESDEREDVF
ncbi:hypothetical protein B4U80_11981 [Leptotrombidium deliense]|uniref:F-box domain-containing protein n=1 Tax=Leptotrombidium deliense TaxID=299467 RepID=A0A443S057_9ACAR|nr:hypothetical protein B4U80_11981 [Leptotrombidium deliense]